MRLPGILKQKVVPTGGIRVKNRTEQWMVVIRELAPGRFYCDMHEPLDFASIYDDERIMHMVALNEKQPDRAMEEFLMYTAGSAMKTVSELVRELER